MSCTIIDDLFVALRKHVLILYGKDIEDWVFLDKNHAEKHFRVLYVKNLICPTMASCTKAQILDLVRSRFHYPTVVMTQLPGSFRIYTYKNQSGLEVMSVYVEETR